MITLINMTTFIDDLGGRKFVFTVVLVVLLTVLLLAGKIDFPAFKDLVVWLAGFFTAGNAVEHLAKIGNN